VAAKLEEGGSMLYEFEGTKIISMLGECLIFNEEHLHTP